MVILDVISIFIITYFLSKISEMNNESMNIMDRLWITMEDYSIQLSKLKVDKFSQDMRILHMKLWMYIYNSM